MKKILIISFLLSIFGCSSESDAETSNNVPQKAEAKQQAPISAEDIKTRTGVMLSNGVIEKSFTYDDLVNAYKNHIFQGASLTTKSVNNGYLMEIIKTDEMTNKSITIKIMFQNHVSDSEKYLIATRIIIDGQEGNSGDLHSVIWEMPVKLCLSQPAISLCKG